jgi:translation initiation factor 2 beta subunit (eIF-2beta)/eIF-5
MKGGTVGGSIISGTVFKDDYFEIRPGFVVKTSSGFVCQPIISKVVSLYSDKEELNQAFPGGLVSLSMDFDPSLSKQNHLVGNILGTPGTLPNIYHTITVIYSVLNKLNKYKSKKMTIGEKIMICVNAKSINAIVSDVLEDKTITLELESPICLDINQKIAILRQNIDKVIVLHSSATFVTGKEVSNIIYDPTTFNRIVAEIPKRQITIINDIKKKTFDFQNMNYDTLLNNIRFVKNVSDSNDTLQVVAPDVKSHNKRSIIINYNIILGSLDNKVENNMELVQNVIKEIESNQKEVINMSDFLSTFIEDELQTDVSVNQDKQLVIKGAYKNANLRNVISKFANKYKLCNNCNSYDTILTKQKNNRIISVKCMKCHADLSVL